MFSKTLLAALILASTSFALTSTVNAAPKGYPTAGSKAPSQAELSWMDRASQVSDAGAQ